MSYRSQRQFKQQQREYEFMQDRRADESFGEDGDPLSEAEKASEWDDFDAFRDDKCLREVDTLFDRMFGVLR